MTTLHDQLNTDNGILQRAVVFLKVDFFDFVGLTTRAEGPQGGVSHAREATRIRSDRHSWGIERLPCLGELLNKSKSLRDMCAIWNMEAEYAAIDKARTARADKLEQVGFRPFLLHCVCACVPILFSWRGHARAGRLEPLPAPLCVCLLCLFSGCSAFVFSSVLSLFYSFVLFVSSNFLLFCAQGFARALASVLSPFLSFLIAVLTSILVFVL